MATKPAPAPEFLTKAECRRLGLARPDVDRMFNRCPLVVLPESKYTYIRRSTMDEWLEQHEMIAPRHGSDD